MIIVIDGPAGSGKSSTAKAVAQQTGLTYIDSGALYRAVSLLYIRCGQDKKLFFDELITSKLRFDYTNGKFSISLNDENVSEIIRSLEVSSNVSIIAAMPKVREFVNLYLRSEIEKGSFIADGRDLSTVVFPDAALKIFMVASIEARAQRRFKELKELGQAADFLEIQKNLAERDHIDSTREEAPLKKHKDAIELDTSNLTFDEQVNAIVDLIHTKGLLTN